MKRQVFLPVLLLVWLAFPFAAGAWECPGYNSMAGGCYVTAVEVKAGNSTATPAYVVALIKAARNQTNITQLEVHSGQFNASIASLEGVMSQLMIALTLGLPVNFACHQKTGQVCQVSNLALSGPGY